MAMQPHDDAPDAPVRPIRGRDVAELVTVVVEQVRPEVTYPLRAEVLRPGLAPLQARFPGDDASTAGHFAAYLEHRVVGVVAVLPEAMPDIEPASEPGWRLRGMAVADGLRGQGIGSALVDRVLEHVARLGGGLLWCHAREPAFPFYVRHGFVARGERWVDPAFGPHLTMTRPVGPFGGTADEVAG